MDRVVCGDVGFGKTEVAMRAAFIAVQSNRQVAVLVPTTLLAQQHNQNFLDRFADWPVRIEVLSRFRTKKQQEQVLKELADGRVDILIGTHKLLQNDVKFKNLGLVVVDEEHRFGVRQKERLKALAGAGRRADDDRHPDPTHFEHVAGEPARFVDYRDTSRGARDHQDVRQRME